MTERQTMRRLLTSHYSRFTQDGLFFYALLGLVAFAKQVDDFVGGELDASTRMGPALGEPHTAVAYCFLGMVSVKKSLLSLIESIAAEADVTHREPSRRPPQGDLLK